MIVTRFAPSPTGFLHLGHAYSAVLNARRAQEEGGRFLLRIEDIDATRCRPEFETAIYEDLRWLGLAWDGPVLRQSERLEIYAEALTRLENAGLLYRCFRTRKELLALSAPHGTESPAKAPGPVSAEEERRLLGEGAAFAWRLRAAAVRDRFARDLAEWRLTEVTGGRTRERPIAPEDYGDVVLARKDVGTSYHLACVVDDAASGVSCVLRGEDLAEAAGLHALLHHLLFGSAPRFETHRLILDDDGRRLAKRDKAATLRHLREAGETPEGVLARLPL